MENSKQYLFGPVPSRRLGYSLGVDIVPLKTCTQNCIYCQLGVDGITVIERKPYVDIDLVLAELKDRIEKGLNADYITLSGSGEPTLNFDFGKLIDGIRQLTDIPIAVITNGTLLSDEHVRADCCKADVVLPSLDAADAETFQRVNCPDTRIDFQTFVDGLCKFRTEYAGKIWLEVFMIDGFNTSDDQIQQLKAIIKSIAPDKIQLNTAVRPTVNTSVKRVEKDKLEAIAKTLGETAEVVANFSKADRTKSQPAETETILYMLKRRPCNLEDICSALGLETYKAQKYIDLLKAENLIISETRQDKTFYKAI